MTDPWRSAKITHFEQVLAAPTVALLRIEARGSRWRPSDATAPPVLVADDGERVNRFAPLPAAPDDHGLLRIEYSLPANVIAPQTVFSLGLADGSLLSLPRPVLGSPRPGQASAASAEPAPAAAAQDHPSTVAAERDAAVSRAEALRQENERLRASVDELEVWRGELERRLAATTTELGTASTRLRENEQELARLRAALAEARAGAQTPPEGEGAALPGRDDEVAALLRAADRVAEAVRELADARARLADAGRDTASGGSVPERPSAAAPPPSTAPAASRAAASVDSDELMRRAAAEANEQAARELAEAVRDGS